MNSVCLASYNGELFIRDQIQSILSQINFDDELVISDDGSKDKTIEIIKSFKDSRIKLIYNKSGRHGYTANFENAINYCKGDIIFFSDQDDVWLNTKYNDVVQLLKTYDLVVTNSIVTDKKLNPINNSFFSIYHSGPGLLKNILLCSTYYGSCMAIRKSLLKYILPFPKTKQIDYDIWIGLIAEVYGKVYFYSKPEILYRRSEAATTTLGTLWNRSDRPLYWKLYKRVIQLGYVIKLLLSKYSHIN